jgi:hypothetical protein
MNAAIGALAGGESADGVVTVGIEVVVVVALGETAVWLVVLPQPAMIMTVIATSRRNGAGKYPLGSIAILL